MQKHKRWVGGSYGLTAALTLGFSYRAYLTFLPNFYSLLKGTFANAGGGWYHQSAEFLEFWVLRSHLTKRIHNSSSALCHKNSGSLLHLLYRHNHHHRMII